MSWVMEGNWQVDFDPCGVIRALSESHVFYD